MQTALPPGFDCKYKFWGIEYFYKGSVREKKIQFLAGRQYQVKYGAKLNLITNNDHLAK